MEKKVFWLIENVFVIFCENKDVAYKTCTIIMQKKFINMMVSPWKRFLVEIEKPESLGKSLFF